MADNTSIEWTDATWNTVGGCTRVHNGCTNCYAEIMAARFSKPGQWGEGLAKIVTRPDGSKDHRWTGEIRFNAKALHQPLRWKRPRRIFVNSTADTFHDGVTDDQLDQIFAVMALCPQHTFQVLTKRPERARAYLSGRYRRADIATQMRVIADVDTSDSVMVLWPLPNIWIGTSISDQASADAMVPHLLATPAAVRFLSVEPMLGPVDLEAISAPDTGIYALQGIYSDGSGPSGFRKGAKIDWVIVGGESGPGARPMHPDWARSILKQCEAAGVAGFFKQWGEWAPDTGPLPGRDPAKNGSDPIMEGTAACALWTGSGWRHYRDGYAAPIDDTSTRVYRLGKARAGRLLDGREWNQMPGGAND